jgi:nuclear GTP-binding protein
MSSSGGKGGHKHRPLTTNPKIINPNREAPKGATHLRDRATIKRIQMYKSKAHYTSDGKFIGGDLMSRKTEKPVVRIAPDRRWFGNTRVVGQRDLEKFRESAGKQVKDPFTVVLHYQDLPMSLIDTTPKEGKKTKVDLLAVESFQDTFGKTKIRNKPKTYEFAQDYKQFVQAAQEEHEAYNADKIEKDMKNKETVDTKTVTNWMTNPALHPKLRKGTSKRIWNELYKVIDSSDILIQVIDARDPMGTRCKRIEDELKTKERRHKNMVFILNKCDLVPVWVTRAWISYLSQEYPTIAMHASITNPFGKSALLQVLRQLSKLHSDKKQISVGFVGYPNVGKSSVINTLMGSVVCPAAPIPGETKHWRYITLFKSIYLIDCPGVVPPNHTSPVSNVLKGAVRVEQLDDPVEYIPHLMAQLRPEYIANQYGIPAWSNPIDFLELYCRRSGKLKQGGEPDLKTGARMILQDWLMGRLPHFVPPPHRQSDWVQLSGESFEGTDDLEMVWDESLGREIPKFAPSRHEANKKRKLMAALGNGDKERDSDDVDEVEYDIEDDDDDDEDLEMEEILDEDDENIGSDDDGLNEDGDFLERDEKAAELRKKLEKIDRIDNKRQKVEAFNNDDLTELQEDDWKDMHVKPRYGRYDGTEESYLNDLQQKQKDWDLFSEEKKKKLIQERADFFTANLYQSKNDEYMLHPAGGGLSHGGKDEIVIAGPLVELSRHGGELNENSTESSEQQNDKSGGYVVTVAGGKIVKGDGSEEIVTKEDLETARLMNLVPKTGPVNVKKHEKMATPKVEISLLKKSNLLLKKDTKDETPAVSRNLNNEKKKKMRAKQRLLGRW